MTTHIPQTDSIEELAHFWDTHDVIDFADELEEVTTPVFERMHEATIQVRLQPEELATLQRLAHDRGIEQATLLREWVVERLLAV